MERDEAKFPPEPYYPWLILPWNVKDDEKCPEYEICKSWNDAKCDQCGWKKIRDEVKEQRRNRFKDIDLSTDGDY